MTTDIITAIVGTGVGVKFLEVVGTWVVTKSRAPKIDADAARQTNDAAMETVRDALAISREMCTDLKAQIHAMRLEIDSLHAEVAECKRDREELHRQINERK